MNKLKKEEKWYCEANCPCKICHDGKHQGLRLCKKCRNDEWQEEIINIQNALSLKKPTKEKIEEMKILKIDPAYVSEDLQVEMNILRSVVNQVIKVVNKLREE